MSLLSASQQVAHLLSKRQLCQLDMYCGFGVTCRDACLTSIGRLPYAPSRRFIATTLLFLHKLLRVHWAQSPVNLCCPYSQLLPQLLCSLIRAILEELQNAVLQIGDSRLQIVMFCTAFFCSILKSVIWDSRPATLDSSCSCFASCLSFSNST